MLMVVFRRDGHVIEYGISESTAGGTDAITDGFTITDVTNFLFDIVTLFPAIICSIKLI